MASIEPGIALVRAARGYRIEQHRPPVGSVLCRLPVDEALDQVTRLLPICGDAQHIAAARAVEAARGKLEDPEVHAGREAALLREQLRTSAWRFCVDWPQLAGEEQALDPMRSMLQAGDLDEARVVLTNLLGGLENTDTLDALQDWLGRADVPAARFAARAVAVEANGDGSEPLAAAAPLRNPAEVLMLCREALTWPEAGEPVTPPSGEVGAFAMARHRLIRGLPDRFGPLATRFLAQALDAAFLCSADARAAGVEPPDPVSDGGQAAPGTGFGWAMTARGPLVHRVVLDAPTADRASRWDVLAPTDWHFGPAGPVAQAVATTTAEPERVRWWAAAFDPCAAWRVDGVGADGATEG